MQRESGSEHKLFKIFISSIHLLYLHLIFVVYIFVRILFPPISKWDVDFLRLATAIKINIVAINNYNDYQ